MNKYFKLLYLSFVLTQMSSCSEDDIELGKQPNDNISNRMEKQFQESFQSIVSLDPLVESFSPASEAGVLVNKTVSIVFEPLDNITAFINPSSLTMEINHHQVNVRRGLKFRGDFYSRTFFFTPFPFWQPNTEYQVKVPKGISFVNQSGFVANDSVWNFKTSPHPVYEVFSKKNKEFELTEAEISQATKGEYFKNSEILTDYRNNSSVLHKVSLPVNPYDDHVKKLALKMKKTANGSSNGLAANQVGLARRLFVGFFNGKMRVVINPVIHSWSDKTYSYKEGGLSVMGRSSKANRPQTINVSYYTINDAGMIEKVDHETLSDVQPSSTWDKMPARVFLHEYDHINGIIMVDREEF